MEPTELEWLILDVLRGHDIVTFDGLAFICWRNLGTPAGLLAMALCRLHQASWVRTESGGSLGYRWVVTDMAPQPDTTAA